MGRAIVREPAAFLMDEPLSNLDAKLRVQMRTELAQLQRRLSTTTLYVTHDQTEAMTMGDRVAVMHQGMLQQVDRPQVLYDRPGNLFVASFLGSPAINLISARLEQAGECRIVARFGSHALTVPTRTFERCPDLSSFVGRDVVLGIRPEDIRDLATAPGADGTQRLRVTIAVVESVGAEVIAHFRVVEDPEESGATPDGTPESDHAGSVSFTARLHPRASIRENEELELTVDVDRLHFFDPETREALGWPPDRAFPRSGNAI
jgi:multiple sugar transport system ATP-binding protein